MARYFDVDKAVDRGYLGDWYQASIDDTIPPIWTDEHLEELTNDFIVIPKDTPTADVVEVVRCKDCIYKTVTEDGEYNPDDIVCGYHMSDGFSADDFCSFGKRKDDT